MKFLSNKKIRTTLCLILVLLMFLPTTNVLAAQSTNEISTTETTTQASSNTLDEVVKETADLLTQYYGISSLQISIMDKGEKLI